MRIVFWWVPSVMKRLKKAWEIILTLRSALVFFFQRTMRALSPSE